MGKDKRSVRVKKILVESRGSEDETDRTRKRWSLRRKKKPVFIEPVVKPSTMVSGYEGLTFHSRPSSIFGSVQKPRRSILKNPFPGLKEALSSSPRNARTAGKRGVSVFPGSESFTVLPLDKRTRLPPPPPRTPPSHRVTPPSVRKNIDIAPFVILSGGSDESDQYKSDSENSSTRPSIVGDDESFFGRGRLKSRSSTIPPTNRTRMAQPNDGTRRTREGRSLSNTSSTSRSGVKQGRASPGRTPTQRVTKSPRSKAAVLSSLNAKRRKSPSHASVPLEETIVDDVVDEIEVNEYLNGQEYVQMVEDMEDYGDSEMMVAIEMDEPEVIGVEIPNEAQNRVTKSNAANKRSKAVTRKVAVIHELNKTAARRKVVPVIIPIRHNVRSGMQNKVPNTTSTSSNSRSPSPPKRVNTKASTLPQKGPSKSPQASKQGNKPDKNFRFIPVKFNSSGKSKDSKSHPMKNPANKKTGSGEQVNKALQPDKCTTVTPTSASPQPAKSTVTSAAANTKPVTSTTSSHPTTVTSSSTTSSITSPATTTSNPTPSRSTSSAPVPSASKNTSSNPGTKSAPTVHVNPGAATLAVVRLGSSTATSRSGNAPAESVAAPLPEIKETTSPSPNTSSEKVPKTKNAPSNVNTAMTATMKTISATKAMRKDNRPNQNKVSATVHRNPTEPSNDGTNKASATATEKKPTTTTENKPTTTENKPSKPVESSEERTSSKIIKGDPEAESQSGNQKQPNSVKASNKADPSVKPEDSITKAPNQNKTPNDIAAGSSESKDITPAQNNKTSAAGQAKKLGKINKAGASSPSIVSANSEKQGLVNQSTQGSSTEDSGSSANKGRCARFCDKACCRPFWKKICKKSRKDKGGIGKPREKKDKNCLRWLCRTIFCCGCGKGCCKSDGSNKSSSSDSAGSCKESLMGCLKCSCCRCCCCRKKNGGDTVNKARKKSNVGSIPSYAKRQSRGNAAEDLPKLDATLVEHNSLIRAAIPVLPIPLAWFCLFLNIFFPGAGTVSSGCFCLCFGKARWSIFDKPEGRLGSFCVNLLVGVGQFFTILFCLVGWGWSIWWGTIMVRVSRKHKRLAKRAREEAAAEATRAQNRAAAAAAAAAGGDVEARG